MREYKEYYGADADGNRGVYLTQYELDSSDDAEIVSQIEEYVVATGSLPDYSMTVYLISRDGEDVAFEIDTYDYVTMEEMDKLLEGLE